MKKKSRSRVSAVFWGIFKLRTWGDWDRIKSFTLALKNGFTRIFVPQQPQHNESFKTAQKTFHLSDEDLNIKQKALLRLSIIMLTCSFLILIYAGYHLFYGTYKAFVVSFVVMLIALVLAFRYHFWYYQIKHRKLGCTVKEWYRQGILGEKK